LQSALLLKSSLEADAKAAEAMPGYAGLCSITAREGDEASNSLNLALAEYHRLTLYRSSQERSFSCSDTFYA